MINVRRLVLSLLLAAVACLTARGANEPTFWQSTEKEDYTIDRAEVFEFTKKPSLARQGDRVTVSFETKGFCDVTVAVENAAGKIIRHLASGVLGPNAPEPFQRSRKSQAVVWDGKDDQGEYVDDVRHVSVRVSLGLKPRFERTLYWHPKRRVGMHHSPRMVAQPEGVYVYEGAGIESIKLFNHEGKYVRTVYPFPADRVERVKGLGWSRFADGHRAPRHIGWWGATYLKGGIGVTHATWGTGAEGFAVRNGRIASISGTVCRMKTDGSTGGVSLYGPDIPRRFGSKKPPRHVYVPKGVAFSPDGTWLYLTGDYVVTGSSGSYGPTMDWPARVYRMTYGSEKPPAVWLGDKPGHGDKSFHRPADVAVDERGRVYVADHGNDRVQIFSPEGKLLKSLPVNGPSRLQFHHKTGDLYVFSWGMGVGMRVKRKPVKPRLRVFAPFQSDEPKQLFLLPLPHKDGEKEGTWTRWGVGTIMGHATEGDHSPIQVALDSWTDPVTVWMVRDWPRRRADWKCFNIERFALHDRKLELLESWNRKVAAEIVNWVPPHLFRQRMHVDHRNGDLYLHQDFKPDGEELLRIRPDTGHIETVKLPVGAHDLAIDYRGHLLLRCNQLVGRFDLDTMREVPFDYGERQRARLLPSSRRSKQLLSALVIPGARTSWNFYGGLGANPQGEIVVHTWSDVTAKGKARYKPRIFPGRTSQGVIHVFDRHGKPVGLDIVGQGAAMGHGTQMDARGDIYFLHKSNRVYDGKDFFPLTGCLIKFERGKGRFLATRRAVLPLPPELRPDIPPQLEGYWVKDVEWIYPAVGAARHSSPCQCWTSRFALDAFGRSFAPEVVRNQVAVLDTNGNLILHVGRYGNVDNGVPLVKNDKLWTQEPRPIGGDEVALMYACYTAVHSDRRLFIADAGNGRILSVKLGYHTMHRIPLRPNEKGRSR
jgi:hypothetical protein